MDVFHTKVLINFYLIEISLNSLKSENFSSV